MYNSWCKNAREAAANVLRSIDEVLIKAKIAKDITSRMTESISAILPVSGGPKGPRSVEEADFCGSGPYKDPSTMVSEIEKEKRGFLGPPLTEDGKQKRTNMIKAFSELKARLLAS